MHLLRCLYNHAGTGTHTESGRIQNIIGQSTLSGGEDIPNWLRQSLRWQAKISASAYQRTAWSYRTSENHLRALLNRVSHCAKQENYTSINKARTALRRSRNLLWQHGQWDDAKIQILFELVSKSSEISTLRRTSASPVSSAHHSATSIPSSQHCQFVIPSLTGDRIHTVILQKLRTNPA